jgi:hypothetical protein
LNFIVKEHVAINSQSQMADSRARGEKVAILKRDYSNNLLAFPLTTHFT